MSPCNRPVLTVFSLAMINFTAVINIRNLPTVAPYGFSMLFFYTMAAFLFLIPSALVAAELASSFPEDGGIYNWVSRAFGKKSGFFVASLQNINNFVCFPTSLSVVASTIAYGFFPSLTNHRIFILSVILIMVWGGTFVTLRGIRITGIISSIGGILGTFLPVIIIVVLCIYWLANGRPSQVNFSMKSLLPDMSNLNNASLILGVLLGFAGLEMSANHVKDLKNPRKDYPKAIFLATIMIMFVSVLGSLAIAVVIPKEDLIMHAGAMQALSHFFSEFKIECLMPAIALLMTFGSIAWFCAWVSGPPRAFIATAGDGHLPKIFHKLNKNRMPINIMLFQAIITTVLSFIFVFAESITTAFLILTDLTAQFLLLMYAFMFSAAIILKFKYSDMHSSYKVPFGKVGMVILAGTGLVSSLVSYVVGFFPPAGVGIKHPEMYSLVIVLGNLSLIVIPIVINLKKRGSQPQ